jgi:hypothetical protein
LRDDHIEAAALGQMVVALHLILLLIE